MWHKTDAVSALFRCGTRQMQSQPYLKIQVQIMLFAIIFKTMLTDNSLSPVEIEYKLLKKRTFDKMTYVPLRQVDRLQP